MEDVRHLRSQAEFCLRLAAQMSDLRTADLLRATASDYAARAVRAETTRSMAMRGYAASAAGKGRPSPEA